MANLFSLDVVFSSETQPYDASLPVVMAYGFSTEVGTVWTGTGQEAESVKTGSEFYFNAFDVAVPPGSAEGMEIYFAGGKTPFVDGEGNSIPNPITLDSKQLQYGGEHDPSVGCNITGSRAYAGPYTLGTEIGSYTCTVGVNVQLSSGALLSFIVDPEIIVEG